MYWIAKSSLLTIALMIVQVAPLAHAASSDEFTNPALSARLVSVEDGVAPRVSSLSIGLDLQLGEGWKTYWRTPGEVGFAPSIEWAGSKNLANAQIFWPAPKRFTAFGIENFGYADQVVLPIQVMLESPGKPVSLVARVSVLTCLDVCVPHDFELRLDIPEGSGIDTENAALVAKFTRQNPASPEDSNISISSVALTDDALVVSAASSIPFKKPDVFPELGPQFTFGKPDIRMSEGNKELWAALPILARTDELPEISITLTDTERAVSASLNWSQTPADPPYEKLQNLPGLSKILSIALLAFFGGLILNVMPCVLPVLSIKIASVLNHRDQTRAIVRTGFLFSALGVMTFMFALAATVLALQMAGFSVGWGLQFQSPLFLIIMFMVLAVFSANLFGVFEISLPSRLQSNLANSGAQPGYLGDFSTGAFAAVLATPCSAPFLGTAVAFALTGRPLDIFLVFFMLGLGLALPYLILARKPEWVSYLPKPGRWMIIVKLIMGALLAATSVWLLWVLSGVAGPGIAVSLIVVTSVFVAVAAVPLPSSAIRAVGLVAISIGALWLPAFKNDVSADYSAEQDWVRFERAEIGRLVSQGKTVFVDVTADWCLTCIANKTLVLNRNPVAELLQSEDIVAMQADWTRPDETIARYLESNNRFGIPFNIVYGPAAPDGILLSEILTTASVLDAIEAAGR